MAIITPYDNKVFLWLVRGDDLGEQSIDQLAQTVLTYAPAVSGIIVKTNDGANWMSSYDSKPAFAVSGPDAIDRWVLTLQRYGLEFHAWCVPIGQDMAAEVAIMTQVCNRPGVRSLILDVEPYQGFWTGGQAGIRPMMTQLRSAIPGTFHLGLSVDPRSPNHDAIFPQEWYPFVNSVHPQVYWADFQESPDVALADTYSTWGNYGRPLFPVLSGFNTDPALMDTARTLATGQYQATGFSWWTLGHIDAAHFVPINHLVNGSAVQPPPGSNGAPVQTGSPIVVTVGSGQYQDGVYDPATTFGTYQDANGLGKYRPTNESVGLVYAAWAPQITQAGWYRIEAFMPAQHASTGNARYKVHGIQNHADETLISAAQAAFSESWLPLGTFALDPALTNSGVVFLDDWTFEPGREIAFDALRWTLVSALPAGSPKMLNVPYRSQEDPDARRFRNDCGPAIVAMYIDWQRQQSGQPPQPVSIDSLAAETSLAQSDTGLDTTDVIALAGKHGIALKLTGNLTIDLIVSEINAGRPPFALINYGQLLGRENQADKLGHFVLITGYDVANIYVNDPDWWNQGSVNRDQGHNWQVPIAQFQLALSQSPAPYQGALYGS